MLIVSISEIWRASFCSWAVQFVSDLIKNSKDRFSCDNTVLFTGLPQQPPSEPAPGEIETGPPVKKSKFKLTQEKAAAAKKRQETVTSDNPEEMLDSE